MDLMCPHCQRPVTVSNEQAGLVANCPHCTKQFMAPALPPAPAAIRPPAPPPPPAIDTYAMGPAPAAPPVYAAPLPPLPQPQSPPPPPLPPGEYTQTFSLSLRPDWLAFVPAGCLGAIFVLSFFSWHHAANLYSLSFTTEAGGNNAHLLFYTILTFLCLLAVVPILLFDKGWIFTPPQLVPLMPWKNLALGCILGFCFLLLCFDYARSHFVSGPNPIELAMKIAFRLQLLAALASFGMFWLHWRKRKNLPLPKIEVRW